MNQNIFGYNIVQQKNNLECELYEANKLIEELQKTLTLLFEASGGTPPPPRPNRFTPPPKPAVRPGTVPGEAEQAPTTPSNPRRPTTPGGGNEESPVTPVWRPLWPGHQAPPTNPLHTPPGYRTPGLEGVGGGGGWWNLPPNPDGYWRPPTDGRQYFSPMGPRTTPLSRDGRFWLLGNDGRTWVWDPSRGIWQLGGRQGPDDSPWGPVNPNNPYITPPSDKPGQIPLPGGGWGTPTVTPTQPSTPKPTNTPLGPTRFPDERPTGPVGPDNNPRGPVPNMFEPSQPSPWWQQFGDSVEYKNNNYLMESAMRMLYNKPHFHQ